VYTPQASTEAVVEYALGLMLDAVRPRPAMKHAVDKKHWAALRKENVGKKQLDECTIGILGFGRIGSRLAQALEPFHGRVIYNDLLEISSDKRSGATPVTVDELFAEADVISIHIDGRADNYHFVGGALLASLKPDAAIINTSRGVVMDAHALAAAMNQRPEARAMIDVHEYEPFGEDYPLLGVPNVSLYPHLASRTDRGLLNMSWVVRDVAAVLEGRKPEFPAP
jgi:phosphoglycerate dehydrogenase-like enzyme